MREQFGRDHPRDGAGAHGEKYDEKERRDDRQIRHPVNHFLHITEKLLSGSRIVFFFPEQPEEFSLRRKLIVNTYGTQTNNNKLNKIYGMRLCAAQPCVRGDDAIATMRKTVLFCYIYIYMYNNTLLLLYISVQAI